MELHAQLGREVGELLLLCFRHVVAQRLGRVVETDRRSAGISVRNAVEQLVVEAVQVGLPAVEGLVFLGIAGAGREAELLSELRVELAERGIVLGLLWIGPKDLQQAAEWYKRAAEQGDPQAQVALGNMYLSGEGVPQDISKAAFWHKKSVKLKKDRDITLD